MTKKGAANFIRWKFLDDLGREGVSLKNMILSHPDFDHYGGMLDVLAGKVMRPDRTFPVEVENFYHNGMGRLEIRAAEHNARFMPLEDTPISTDFVYGLISVRTDGARVLCGYMKEGGNDFDIQVFRGGVEP
jgi:metal-dependent hydrolase (beta-lactamase superfamily II)